MVALFSVISKATTKLLEEGADFGPRDWQFAGRPFPDIVEAYSLYVIHLFTWMSVIILGVVIACIFEQYLMGTFALSLTYRMYAILRYMDFAHDRPWVGSSTVTQFYFAFFSIGGTKLSWKTICGFNTPRAVSLLEIRMYKKICRYENKWYVICLAILALVYQLESYWTPIADEVFWFVLILQSLPFILGLMEGRRQFRQFSGYNNTLNEDN